MASRLMSGWKLATGTLEAIERDHEQSRNVADRAVVGVENDHERA